MYVKVLITGKPGVGKTTLVKRILDDLLDPVGFYTEEIRKGGKRLGFMLKTTWGDSLILAHVDLKTPFKVSKYGVDVKVMDSVVRRMEEEKGSIVVLDEVGKMELFSKAFRVFVENLLVSDRPFVVTAPLKSKDPLILKLKATSQVVYVTEKNRDELPEKLLSLIPPSLKKRP